MHFYITVLLKLFHLACTMHHRYTQIVKHYHQCLFIQLSENRYFICFHFDAVSFICNMANLDFFHHQSTLFANEHPDAPAIPSSFIVCDIIIIFILYENTSGTCNLPAKESCLCVLMLWSRPTES